MDSFDLRYPGNESGILDPDTRATMCSIAAVEKITDDMKRTGCVDGTLFKVPEADFPLRKGWFYHASEKDTTKNSLYLMQRYLATVGNGGTMNIGIAPNKEGLMADEDVQALKGFGVIRKRFFEKPVEKGSCNVVVMREDLANGELVDDWILCRRGAKLETILTGHAIGIKRIRTLKMAVPAEELMFMLPARKNATDCVPQVKIEFYYADPELMEAVEKATRTGGDSVTARWMREGKEGS